MQVTKDEICYRLASRRTLKKTREILPEESMFFNISTTPPKFVLGDVSRAPGVDAVDKELGHGSDGDGRRRRRKIPLTDRRRPLDKQTNDEC
jgi:hypothetical protein